MKKTFLSTLSLLFAAALCVGCTQPTTAPATDPATVPQTTPATAPATTQEPTLPEVNIMDQFEKVELTAEKLNTANWNATWGAYMFPQDNGALQFGMGGDGKYCLGAYGNPDELANKVVVFDMAMVLSPSAQILLRGTMNSGVGKGNPCYLLVFADNGTEITVKLNKFDQEGTGVALTDPVVLADFNPYDYNRFEVGVINEGEDVHLVIAVNGKLIVDYVDKAPEESYRQSGRFFIQGGYSILNLRGTDSDAVSQMAGPVKVGEYKGIDLYDISRVDSANTRVLTTITTPREFTSTDGFKMNYRIYLPTNYDPNKEYPLHLHLHGGGARGTDNLTQISVGFPEFNPLLQKQKEEEFILVIPQAAPGNWWSDSITYNYDELRAYVDITNTEECPQIRCLMQMMDSIANEFSVDNDRWYFSGYSMGGHGGYVLLARYPEKFAAAVIGCGASDPTAAELLAKTPLYILHGTEDTSVSVERSREMVAALEAINSTNHVYVELQGRPHGFYLDAQGNEDKELLTTAINWAYAKTK